MRVGPAVCLFASFASAKTLTPGARAQAHATVDIYNTGGTTHPTGLAVGLEGRSFEWQGPVSLRFPLVWAAGAGTVFELFAGFGFIALVLTARWLPETTGWGLERIELEQLAENECEA